MKIGLISDTHGDLTAWKKALSLFGKIDIALHAGDILSSGPFNPRKPSYKPAELAEAINSASFPTIFAKGNCDAEIDTFAIDYPIESPYAFVFIDGLRIMVTHGHHYGEKELAELGRRYGLNLIVRGHSHLRGISADRDIMMVNPGSASLPKGEDETPSVGIIEGRSITIISLNDGMVIESAEIP
ncbi:MAG TPA: phosphodiesterase [Candidatus Aquicultor sp.]